MQETDYYNTLSVGENASDASIKKAYRKLAKECHPDTHPGDRVAEQKFKEISEAYSVLSDSKKRQQYDQLRRYGLNRGGGRRPGGFTSQGSSFDLNDLFGARGPRRRTRREGIDLDEVFGFGGLGDIFSQVFGQGARNGTPRGARKTNDIHASLEIPFETAVLGGKATFAMEPGGRQYALNVLPGTMDGKVLKLTGQGKSAGKTKGDLFVTLQVAKHRFFRMDGLNIKCDIQITKKQAKKGATVRVKNIHGKTVHLSIPCGTTSGKVFRLSSMGIKKGTSQGDQYVSIEVK